MRIRFCLLLVLTASFVIPLPAALAVRLPTSISTTDTLGFDDLSVISDGAGGIRVVATGNLINTDTDRDRTIAFDLPAGYSLASPATVTPLPLSTIDALLALGTDYDVDFSPVISPDGLNVIVTHDGQLGGSSGNNTLFKVPLSASVPGPITGEPTSSTFNGLFSGPIGPFDLTTSNVGPGTGTGNIGPLYTPSGSSLIFLGGGAGSTGGDPEDVLFTVPATGGTPTAITPLNEDIDAGLYHVSGSATAGQSTFIYAAPDVNGINTQLFTRQLDATTGLPVAGAPGVATTIPLGTPPNPGFDIEDRVSLSADGSMAYFIGDYETGGSDELFKVPVDGSSLPTRVSDDLPANAEVTDFVISPDGLSVAYIAGQNDAATNEVFYANLDGSDVVSGKKSIRVSEAPATAHGENDVFAGGGADTTLAFSPDGTRLLYLGDQTNESVNDLYIVDLTEKGGLVPSVEARTFTYTGADDGNFATVTNWDNPNVAGINNPTPEVFDGDIGSDLTVDGKKANAGDINIGESGFGTLTLINGATFAVGSGDVDFDLQEDGILIASDSTITSTADVILRGELQVSGGTIQTLPLGDDLRIEDEATGTITNATLIAADDIVIFPGAEVVFDNVTFTTPKDLNFEYDQAEDTATAPGATIINSTITLSEDIDIDRHDYAVSVTDTDITAERVGSESGNNGGQLTLLGDSTLTINSVIDGSDVFLDDTSAAMLNGGAPGATSDYLGEIGQEDELPSSITLLSAGAELTIADAIPDVFTGFDPREFIFNGLTGMTYNEDPSAWNIADWDGIAGVTLSLLLGGDFDVDGDVDGADFLAWQRNFGTADRLAAWQANYGTNTNLAAISAQSVPEPTACLLAILALGGVCATRRRN